MQGKHPRPSLGRSVPDHDAYAELMNDDEILEYLPFTAPNPDHTYIAVKSYWDHDPMRFTIYPHRRPSRPELIIVWDERNREIHAIHGVGTLDSDYLDLALLQIDPPRDLEHLYQLLAPTVDRRNEQAAEA